MSRIFISGHEISNQKSGIALNFLPNSINFYDINGWNLISGSITNEYHVYWPYTCISGKKFQLQSKKFKLIPRIPLRLGITYFDGATYETPSFSARINNQNIDIEIKHDGDKARTIFSKPFIVEENEAQLFLNIEKPNSYFFIAMLSIVDANTPIMSVNQIDAVKRFGG